MLLQYYRQGVMFAAGNAFKRVEYRYDLVSGKVNEVAYQPGQADGFYHRYHYDAENRLTGAESSRDRLLWQQDAAYRYYRHGPLARTQLGQLNVQGIDYAYTLQGWLKGVNSSQIGKGGSAYYDMGGDDGSSISQTAKDVYSYSLHYYDDAGRSDYRPIGRAVVAAPFSNFEQVGGSVSSPLYNGNIAAMGVQIDYGAGGGGQGTGLREPLLYGYRYDQLHRLVGMQAHRNLVNNQWRPVALDDYREWVSYDANGNIRSYDRNGTTTAYGTPVASHALEMNRLSYGYTEVSLNGRQVLTSNRLRHVKDQVSDANRYTEDIDNQADDNYSYDAIGNLVRDQQGGSEEIRWTVYGKIAGIHKTDGTQVYYSYDAAGNRISKTVDRSGSTNPSAGITTTWYVRDAQGNVLSTYEKRGNSPLEQTELHLYGSSRLGIQRTGGLVVEGSLVSPFTTETLVRGRKLYELSNHLGNVLATITDKKVLVAESGNAGSTGGVCANGGLVEVLDLYNRDGSLSSYRARQEINFYSAFESGSSDEWEGYIDAGATLCDNNGGSGTGSGMPAGSYYVADLVSATDYAPFGMGLVGRTYNAGAYKYGFNGQERSTEIDDNSYTAEFWQYDSRIGRRWNVDPVSNSSESPYVTNSNNPILSKDPTGAVPEKPKKEGTSEGESQSTSETTYGLHQIARTTTKSWYWHAGSSEYSTKAGWYTSEDYANVLRPIGKELAQYEGLYTTAASVGNPNWTEAQKADVANTRLGRFIGTGISDNAAKHLYASAHIYANQRNFSATGYIAQSSFNVEDMLGVGLAIKSIAKAVVTKLTAKNFYSVQGLADMERLMAGGTPWPSASTRAQWGAGIYTWGTKAEAKAYLKLFSSMEFYSQLRILEFSIHKSDFRGLRSFIVPENNIGDLFMSKFSRLYGDGLPHNLQYIKAANNFGHEHYFSSDLFKLFKIKR